jgi:uncharacterized membrane protein
MNQDNSEKNKEDSKMNENGERLSIQDASSWILRTGVATSVTVMIIGIIFSYARGEVTVQKLENQKFIDSLHFMLTGAMQGRGLAIIEIGIFILVLTPIMRVATAMALFAIEDHDWLYTGITFFVLLMTLAALFLLK